MEKVITLPKANLTEGEILQIVIAPENDKHKFDIKIYKGDTTNELIEEFTGLVGAQNQLFDTSGQVAGDYMVRYERHTTGAKTAKSTDSNWFVEKSFKIAASQGAEKSVTLQRTGGDATADQALWVAIRNRTSALGFERYQQFVDSVFKKPEVPKAPDLDKKLSRHMSTAIQASSLSLQGSYAYSVLKFATQAFLTLEAGVAITDTDVETTDSLLSERSRLGESSVTYPALQERLKQYLTDTAPNATLPYLDRIVGALFKDTPSVDDASYAGEILANRFTEPSLIELIWSYWHEEGMLAQTMNTIALRFQNQRLGTRDPLADLEVSPLLPLSSLIWGYIQDEHNRLTVRRRAFEYDHHYGLKLVGRAIPELNSADCRSKFIESFHNLLYRTAMFYREDADTTVVSDSFPLLNALKDVHLLLAEGMHNQYGDLPWTSRAEMLTEQYILARPEMREFLRGRQMVPYQESWMGAVDAMKKLQGWGDTTITHFNELAVDGERILLSIRFGDWSDLNNSSDHARNWARYWKPEIQRYLYGYLAVTGVDLMADTNDSRKAPGRYAQPSQLLQQRLEAQGGGLSSAGGTERKGRAVPVVAKQPVIQTKSV